MIESNLAESLEEVQDEFQHGVLYERQKEIEDDFKNAHLPRGYFFKGDNLYFQEEPLDDKDAQKPLCVSSRLEVVAVVRDHQNENFGRLLVFPDADGVVHTISIPMSCLATDGAECRSVLMSKGLIVGISQKAKNLLTQYIQLCKPAQRVRCVLQTGWHHNCYVFQNETIGSSGTERILYQSSPNNEEVGVRGTLQEWQEISILSRGNSRLVFALSAAFASPLLSLLGEEGGGFHIRGQSSTGKTTAVKVACSVWGGPDYLQSWRATSNGLEGVASGHNDSLLCLDEIEEISSIEIGNVAYMLANGAGKARSNKFGSPIKKASWKILFLSTGEISLADHMQQVGKKTRAGQEVRIIDVKADTGKFGIFEELHGFETPDAFSKHLCKLCKENYGVAARAFLRHVVVDNTEVRLQVKQIMKGLEARFLPKSASGQVSRVFHRFALVAAAGEIASAYGITGWEAGEAEAGVMCCFDDWLQNRGGVGLYEEQAVLAQVRKFFELHGSSRFASCYATEFDPKINQRAGFYKITDLEHEYLVLPEVYRNEICLGYDPAFVSKVCIQHGYLIPGAEGKTSRPERIPAMGKGTKRVYYFSSKVLMDEAGETGVTA